MFTTGQYVKAATLQEAWELNQKKANAIVGGMGWMKMGRRNYAAVIDMSGLGLDKIEENADEFVIGAMVTLRQIEMSESLNSYFGGAPRECVRHIVGVQFRNCATIGGSLWLRPGFSDPLTMLLSLDTQVELYVGGDERQLISLEEFISMKKDRSIITAVHVKKDGRRVAYESFRNTETDFPVLAVSVSKKDGMYTASIGARPGAARMVTADSTEELTAKAGDLPYGKNIRGTASYRKMLAGVLIERAAKSLED